MNESTYQEKLLHYLDQNLSSKRIWPIKGRKTTYLGRLLRPDIEIESDFTGKLTTIAIVELKFNSRFSMWQPMVYAFAKDVPAYCAVDGFKRTRISWRFNRSSSQFEDLDVLRLEAHLLEIKKAIEEFNHMSFI